LGERNTIIGFISIDLQNAMLGGGGHRLMHAFGVGTFDKVRRPAIAAKQALQFIVAYARQQGWIVDLVAVEMKDGQHRAVARGIEELVHVPRSRQRAGLGLAIANDGSNNQIRIVESCAAGVR
jgi:hypothetical protein